jgi:23S rRNA (adenine2503-C2)-methyltransferase
LRRSPTAISCSAQRTNLLDFDLRGLEAFFAGLGEKTFRATQLMKWIYHEGCTDFAAMTNLSKALRARLAEECEIRGPESSTRDQQSTVPASGCWPGRRQLRRNRVHPREGPRHPVRVLAGGLRAELQFLLHRPSRAFNRNLSTAEIIGQVWLASNSACSPH